MRTRRVSRRTFLESSALLAAAIGSHPVAQVEGQSTRDYVLTAQLATVEVEPGRRWSTWAYDGRVPGSTIRVREGERLRVTLENLLPEPTTIHWHGLPVPNAMDGVPGVTQPAIPPNGTFTYDFVAGPAGTYFYHSHVGLQLDRGLAGALIVEDADPDAASGVDRELILMLDDWLDGSPEAALDQMARAGGGMMGGPGGMGMTDGPAYAGYLLNGRSAAVDAIRLRRGDRVRLRIINAAAATTFRLGVMGHDLLVTHADGQPVEPVAVDTIVIGMGERYDILLQADNPGGWWLVAGSVDSTVPGQIVPVIYEGYEQRTPPAVWPSALLRGRRLRYDDLRSARVIPRPAPGRIVPLTLAGGMAGRWTINGQAWPDADPIRIGRGERVRLAFSNMSPVRHPMHLHGHFFDVVRADRDPGPVKDTVVVEPMMGRVDVDFTADNPGRWLLHCHHAYHMEMGMIRVVEVG